MYRLEWFRAFIDEDRIARREIQRLEWLIDKLLDRHGTSLRDEPGIGPVAAAMLLHEFGDPDRFDREPKSARWPPAEITSCHFEIDTAEAPLRRAVAAVEISPRSTANTIRTCPPQTSTAPGPSDLPSGQLDHDLSQES